MNRYSQTEKDIAEIVVKTMVLSLGLKEATRYIKNNSGRYRSLYDKVLKDISQRHTVKH